MLDVKHILPDEVNKPINKPIKGTMSEIVKKK
jgi:hypothetical protein